MRHRVAMLGSSKWLRSPHVRRVRLDGRIASIDARSVTTLLPCHSSDITMVMVQLGVDVAAGLAAIESMSRPHSAVRCIAVTSSAGDHLLGACVEAGAWGRVCESADARELLDVIHSVAAGRLVYPQDVLDRIVTHRGRMTVEHCA